jgi:hypothetical protein
VASNVITLFMLSIVQGNWVPHFTYDAICCWSSKLEFCKSHTCSREHSRFPHRRSRTLDAHNQERRSSCVETAPQVSPCTALAAKLVASLGPRVQPSPASAIAQAAAHLCALSRLFSSRKNLRAAESVKLNCLFVFGILQILGTLLLWPFSRK